MRASLGAAALACAFVFVIGTSAAEAFDAHGSGRQGYVTRVAPHARMALIRPTGHRAARKRADGMGGLVFRGVKPGAGWRVRLSKGGTTSGPLPALSPRA